MIQLKNITKISNNTVILKDISLTINKNKLIILKGISGSGKSTLLSIIGSLLKPTSGFIAINNEQISKLPDIHLCNFRLQHIGFVFQSFNLFEELTVYDNLLAALLPTNQKYTINDTKIKKALKLINIDHKSDQIVSTLSGGEKQRVSIARALVNNPEIILCDEPTSALDMDNSLIFCDIIYKLKQLGKTIIIATHDPLFDNLTYIDKTIKIDNGTILNE